MGLVLAAVFVFLAARNVSWEALRATLATVNALYLVPAGICSLIGYGLRTLRWQRLLAPAKVLPISDLFPILILGFAANNVLPARIGEFVRAHKIGRQEEISRALSLTTIVVERVFDGLTLLLFLGIVLLARPVLLGSGEVELLAIVAAAVFIGAAVGFGVLLIWEDLGRRFVQFALRPLPARFGDRLGQLADSLFGGLQALRHRRGIAAIAGCSLVVWTAEAAGLFVVLTAFPDGLTPPDRLLAAAFALVFVNLGIMLPSAPGYVGTFHFFGRTALAAFGLTATVGLSVAIISHAVQYVLVTGLGLAFFLQDQLTAARMPRRIIGRAGE